MSKKFGRNQKRKLKKSLSSAEQKVRYLELKQHDQEYAYMRHHTDSMSVTLELARLVKDAPGDTVMVFSNEHEFKRFAFKLLELGLEPEYKKGNTIKCGAVTYKKVTYPFSHSTGHQIIGCRYSRVISLVGRIKYPNQWFEDVITHHVKNPTIHEVNP